MKSPSGGMKKTVENMTYEERLRKTGSVFSKEELGEYTITVSRTSKIVIFIYMAISRITES